MKAACAQYVEAQVKIPTSMLEQVIDLLRKKEPVEVIIGTTEMFGSDVMNYYQCGACGNALGYHDKFCRTCGRELKWS